MPAAFFSRPWIRSLMVRLAAVLLAVVVLTGLFSTGAASAATANAASAQATKSQMVAIAQTIDPHHTISWVWTPSRAFAGQAEPWNRKILVSSTGVPARYLRAVMLHEWSHVLQYRAFGSDWWAAVQAFNALLGHPDDQDSYSGLEHGADCIALAMGANYQGYGCPAALRVFGARIAHGTLMNKVQGALESVTVAKGSVVVTGWSIDPSQPTRSNVVRITDNGKLIGGSIGTSVLRTTINSLIGVTGRHGFQAAAAVKPGRHLICVSSSRVSAGQAAVTLAGCRTVTA